MGQPVKKLKQSQFVFLIAAYVSGSALIVAFMDTIAKQNTWIVVIAGYVVSIPFLLCYMFLSKRFPGKNLIEINDIIYGRVLGKVVSTFYVVFMLLLLAFNVRDMASFYTGYIVPETSEFVFALFVTLAAAFAVYKGLHSIAKVSMIAVFISILVIAGTMLLLLGEMDFKNFLPILEIDGKTFLQSVHVMAGVPFGELIIFLMMMPYLSANVKKPKSIMQGALIATILFVMITVRNTAVLGASAGITSQASFHAVRLINIGEFLSRIELFVAIGITIILFVKITVLYFTAVTGFSTLFRMRSAGTLIIPLGAIAVIIGMIRFRSIVAHAVWGTNYSMMFEMPFVMILPVVSLLVAKLRRLPTGPK